MAPWIKEVPRSDLPAHLIYATAALLAGVGASVLPWTKAYRPLGDDKSQALGANPSVPEPYRYSTYSTELGSPFASV
jgi:hypothetical protein